MRKKRHWFVLTFFDVMKNGCERRTNEYVGLLSKNITLWDIADAKKSADLPDDAVVLACIYMGYMRERDFHNV